MNDNHRQIAFGKVLLVLQASVKSHKNVETIAFGNREQLSILLPIELGFWNRGAFMVYKADLKLLGEALVEENSHPTWSPTSNLANSSAETAASRVTVENRPGTHRAAGLPLSSPTKPEMERGCHEKPECLQESQDH